MTPERLAELREIMNSTAGREALEWIDGKDVDDLLDIAESHARLLAAAKEVTQKGYRASALDLRAAIAAAPKLEDDDH